MAEKTNLRRFFEKNGINDISLCLHPLHEIPEPDRRDLFHYHIEKCGGMAVGTALQGAALIRQQTGGNGPCTWFRAGSSIAEQLGKRAALPGQALATYVGEYGGPCFGSHLLMSADAIPFAFFRDPFDRLVSHYYYECRRGYRSVPSRDGFAAYIRAPKNFCFQTQMMAVSPYSGSNEAALLREAERNLSHLAVADMHSNMEARLLELWTAFDLPPVITERLHANEEKPFDFEDMRDEVEQRHWADYRLVEAVRANPRRLLEIDISVADPVPRQGLSCLIADEQTDRQATLLSKVCDIETVKKAATLEPVHSFRRLFDAFATA